MGADRGERLRPLDSRNAPVQHPRMKSLVALLMLTFASSALSAKPELSGDAQFRRWLIHYLKSDYRDDPDLQNLVYGYALVDLNGDGRDEAVVWARNASCGTGGCDLNVFVHRKSGWDLFSSTTITRPPIKLLPQRHRGWRDLASWQTGGGIERPYEARLRFNGTEYEIAWPKDFTGKNPRPPRLEGRTLIGDATIPLFPSKCHKMKEAPSAFGPIPLKSAKRGSC